MKVPTRIHLRPHVALHAVNVLQVDVPAAGRLLRGISSRVAATLIQVMQMKQMIRGQCLDTGQQQADSPKTSHFYQAQLLS